MRFYLSDHYLIFENNESTPQVAPVSWTLLDAGVARE
jgi:hypothetical protein